MKLGVEPEGSTGLQFDSRLVSAKRCPRINRQTQVYRHGVEGADGGIQVDRHRLFSVQRARHGDQVLRETVLQRRPMRYSSLA